ncbi:MAG: putative membrane protein [Oceanospirillaceae bacterium]|jgi:uncharacterized membrane protein
MNLEHMYDTLSFIHLSTIGPAFVIGSYMMLAKKGTGQHKFLGRIYMVLMLFTASVTLFMSAEVGPTLFDHFGFIHLLSLLVLYKVPSAYFAIKAGDVKAHKSAMIGLYIGGMLVAGGFTLVPGRFLGDLIFG